MSSPPCEFMVERLVRAANAHIAGRHKPLAALSAELCEPVEALLQKHADHQNKLERRQHRKNWRLSKLLNCK